MPQDVYTASPELLKELAPRANAAVLVALPGACLEFGITTAVRLAAFLAQMDYESMGFTRLVENLRYSPDRLIQVFGRRHFPTWDNAYDYASRGQVAIANHVYANRMGNGDEKSGDGWRYRGRGIPQLTGLKNYLRAEKALGLPLTSDPDQAAKPDAGARLGAWFFFAAGCNALADMDNFLGITRAINGGENGLFQRKQLWKRYRVGLGLQAVPA